MDQNNQNILKTIPPVTLNIIIINILCWLLELVFKSKGIDLTEILGLHYFKSPLFYPHQIITYMFMHDPSGITHVLFNMFAVFMFGRTLEMIWGSKRFLIYYLLTGIGAGLVNLFVVYLRINYLQENISPELLEQVYLKGSQALSMHQNFIDETAASLNLLINTSMVGASGAVFGILVAFGMFFPNVKLMVMPIPVPIKAKYFVIGYGVIELVLGLNNASGDNIAHFAHLGGLIVGFIISYYWKRKNTFNDYYY